MNLEQIEPKESDLLIYGKEYHLWREGKYIGIATYTDDENIGDSFLKEIRLENGEASNEVYRADKWQFV